ncbi:AMP-binding protein [Bacillus sp. REN10]|uniref:phenylacetate--CoA ligase family protein n=1 Tax=Bacillus sp. REN10 TaxID=2782541 RepID=UPI00193BBF55|nr:AMP-binding protein [Bacillus sp. REN10]
MIILDDSRSKKTTNEFISYAAKFNEKLKEEGRDFESILIHEKQEYHLEMLQKLLRYAMDNNKHYQEFYGNLLDKDFYNFSLEDFAKLPFLEKKHLYDNLHEILCVNQELIAQYHSTSGTSGKSIYTCLTLDDMYVHETIPKYKTNIFTDIHASDVVAIALPYELAQPALGFHRMFQIGYETSIVSLGKGGYMAPPKRSTIILKDLNATILITTPSYISILLEMAEELGIDVNNELKVRKLILTGEGCSTTFLSRLKEMWNVEIEFIYGSTECGLVGVQKDSQSYYTLLEGGNYVEVVNPETLEPVKDNQLGEIVITTLLKEGMPFIRYRTGDLGFLQDSNKENGLKKLYLRGRKGSTILVEGVEYNPIAIEHFLLMHKEVGLWYQLIVEDEKLIIEIEPKSKNISEDYLNELVSSVKRHMFSKAGIPCDVQVNLKMERQFTKVVRVIKNK